MSLIGNRPFRQTYLIRHFGSHSKFHYIVILWITVTTLLSFPESSISLFTENHRSEEGNKEWNVLSVPYFRSSSIKLASSIPWLAVIDDISHKGIQRKRAQRRFLRYTPKLRPKWNAKRKDSFNRILSDKEAVNQDDEVLFDINGMPIELHDDDDDVNQDKTEMSVGDGPSTNGTNEQQQINVISTSQNLSFTEGSNVTNKPELSFPPLPLGVSKNDTYGYDGNSSANGNNKVSNMEHHDVNENNYTVTHKSRLFNNTQNQPISGLQSGDTIFDDILRGFSFASIFCMCVICLHKACWYLCVRCGIVPDERVLEARYQRYQLKNKRAYFNPHAPPPLDTKSLGKWLAERDTMLGFVDGPYSSGIWDSDAERSVDSWDDSSAGVVDFDEKEIQMPIWDKGNVSSAPELEYGEGNELEDKSHDERLFDSDDGGEGMKKEAKLFFECHSLKGSKPTSLEQDTRQVNNIVSNHAFFHAESGDEALNGSQFEDGVVVEDREYDVESDVLGLRSHSPPPLDLEEIEKKLRENMENAKFF